MIELDIAVECGGWAALGDVEALARRAAASAFAAAGHSPEEPVAISLLLSDDATIRDLNRTWREKDKATNVLSFPAPIQPGSGARPLGDVVLALETVRDEAESAGKTLANHATHLIVHGVLHLLGYDHEAEAEAEAMEALEIEALARLGIPDPYRDLAA